MAAVTDGASGIGLACIKAMLAAGDHVASIDRAADRPAQIRAELGPQAFPSIVDRTDKASVGGMLTRPRTIVIRDIVVLPQGLDL